MIITRIWKDQPGRYFCISTKDHKGNWKDHFFSRGQFKTVPQFLKDNHDKDLYWCPHGFTRPRRLKQNTEPPKLLWADLDESDPREMEGLMPSVAWESSPGRYAAVWFIDEFTTEDLNRGLTYHIKADPGGWDFTQVLRVPGSLNYKYDSKPKVRLMWADGPAYSAKEIRSRIPQAQRAGTRKSSTSHKIYKKYEKHLPGKIRRELLNGKPTAGKRSEVFWRLVNELLEVGMSGDECFEVLRDSAWNKFKNRRDSDEQLRREISKAQEKHLNIVEDDNDTTYGQESRIDEEDDDDREDYKPMLGRSMADVEAENIDWIWYPYIARGELTILEGDPGLGKSYLAQIMSIHVCDGTPFPHTKGAKIKKGKVAYFDIENSAGSVTKKRLGTNGLKNMGNFFQEEEPFSIDDEDALDRMHDALERVRPDLVVFDTLNTYIGKADTHKAAEVQQSFKQFSRIAKGYNCSVVVLRHLTKSSKDRAIYRGQGSIAFTGLARVVMTVMQHPEDSNYRALAITKINVARPPKAKSFTILSLPDKNGEKDRSRFKWGADLDMSADEIILAPPPDKEDKDVNDQLAKFAQTLLSDGKMPKQEFEASLQARGFSTGKTLAEQLDGLGIKKIAEGNGSNRRFFYILKEPKSQ